MAEGMAVKQDIKTVPMKYNKDRSEETAELAQSNSSRPKRGGRRQGRNRKSQS